MWSRTKVLSQVVDNHFSLCVIGGGATGAACALDAQLRGIRTVLLEAGDFAGGTSTTSTKIVHGGVRYLEEAIKGADLREYHVLVRALHERVRMLENAPHLTRKLEFLVPSFSWIDVAYLDIGLKIYDWLAGQARISPSRYLSTEETLHRMPGLTNTGLKGSVAYADGQFDDARYNISLVQSFAMANGTPLNYATVTGFQRDASGRISGVFFKDELRGDIFTVYPEVVINATGPTSDSIRQMAAPASPRRMRPSKGAHILLPAEIFPTGDALLIPRTEDGRVLFAIPWGNRVLVGTTDEEVEPGTELVVTQADVEYLLRHLNRYLSRPVTPEDVVSGFAGARPLVASNEEKETKKLARDDVIEVEPVSGLVSIMGGKWTTHRAMAEDTIDRVQERLGTPHSSSATRHHVLYGGTDFTDDYWKTLVRQYPINQDTARHLSSKFGTASNVVLTLLAEDPELALPIIEDHPAIRAEIVYCARNEMAITIEDILARRLGIQFFSWRGAIRAAPVVAQLMARELNWNDTQRRSELHRYIARINHFLESAGLATEHEAEVTVGEVAMD